jgi:hypothetical protein
VAEELLDQDQVQMHQEVLVVEELEETLAELQEQLIQVLEVEDLMLILMEIQVPVEKVLLF